MKKLHNSTLPGTARDLLSKPGGRRLRTYNCCPSAQRESGDL